MSDPEAGEPGRERARLEKKPILEWTRADWQLWAAGLSEPARGTHEGEPVLVRSEPVPIRSEPVCPSEPVVERSEPILEQAPDPMPTEVAASTEAVTEPSVETAEPVNEKGSVTSEPAAQDLPAEVQEAPPTQRPARASASPSASTGPSATRSWHLRPPEAAVQTVRVRARSAVGLMMLALAVGALVAGLVTVFIVVSGLVLRRALGS